MKKLLFLILTLAFGLSLYSVAQAAPLLVCDPAPANDQVTEVQVIRNGVAGSWVAYTTQTISGVVYCVLQDLAPLANGNYTVTAKFRNAWGESPSSSPFTFTKQLPSSPSGMAIK